MRKYPNTLVEAIKRIKSDAEVMALLCRQKDDMQYKFEAAQSARVTEASHRRAAESERDETRKNFADLKHRLLTAETEVARLNGYMERVREDDNVADPLVEIEDQNGRRSVSKRHPSPRYHGNDGRFEDCLTMKATEKRKHWTSY